MPAPFPPPEMVAVPGGTVDLRDDRRGTRWQVDVAPFLLGRFPVTAGLHAAVTGTAPSGSSAAPVTDVSWFDAVEVCNELSARSGLTPAYSRDRAGGEVRCDWAADGYRLPTEAEWQHGCRAGTRGYRYGDLDDVAWYADNSDGQAHELGGGAANTCVLAGILGNVWNGA